jgi:hypothetical protein
MLLLLIEDIQRNNPFSVFDFTLKKLKLYAKIKLCYCLLTFSNIPLIVEFFRCFCHIGYELIILAVQRR